MRRTITAIWSMLAVLQISNVFAQDAGAAQVIADIEQQIANAWVRHDRAAIDAILAPDWSVTDAAGRVLPKAQVMQESFDSTDRRIDSMTIDDVKVRTFGDFAVATGRTRASGTYQGTSASVVLRFTDVFVRKDGRWQVVASHGSMVAP